MPHFWHAHVREGERKGAGAGTGRERETDSGTGGLGSSLVLTAVFSFVSHHYPNGTTTTTRSRPLHTPVSHYIYMF